MKTEQFFFYKSKGFLRGLFTMGQIELRANICAVDTPDIIISRDYRRNISWRVSLWLNCYV